MRKMLHSFDALARRLDIPAGSTVELLAPCNLRCPHCYVDHAADNRLSLPVLQDLLDQMQRAGSFYVTFTGGEIALRRDLFAIIAAARRRHFAVYLLSSGTRWQAHDWDRLAELGVAGVRLSLYGVTPAVHDMATQTPGSWQKTMATLDGLLERGVDVALSTPVMACNVGEVAGVLQLAAQRRISVAMDPNITADEHGSADPKTTLASAEQLRALHADPVVRHYVDKLLPDAACAAPDASDRPCGTGEASTFIRCSGDVFPCAVWPAAAGNILHTPLLEIFRQSPVFVQARALTNQALGACNGCGDRSLCAPCAAMNLQDMGATDSPSPTVCATTAARSQGVRGYSEQAPDRRRRLRVVA